MTQSEMTIDGVTVPVTCVNTVIVGAGAAGMKRIVFENPRGNIKVTGGDSKDVTVNGRKLVNAYRREDAERHWREFSAAFTNPDPEVRHLLDEARAAIASLRAMSPRKG